MITGIMFEEVPEINKFSGTVFSGVDVEITSRQNPRIKEFMQLAKRSSDGRVLVEGVHLLQEALRSGVEIEAVLTVPRKISSEVAAAVSLAQNRGIEIVEMSEDCYRKISLLKSGETVGLIYRNPVVELSSFIAPGRRIVVLDNIQDPGNAGAIVRIAEATGMAGCVFIGGTTLTNGKFIRASMGTVFRVPCASLERSDLPAMLQEFKVKLLVSELEPAARPFRRVDFRDDDYCVGICFGSEGGGVSADILRLAAERFYIPMVGAVESLNVAVAAGIVLYHAGMPDN